MPGVTLYDISEHLIALCDSYDLCETDDERAACKAEIEQTIDAQLHKVDSFTRFLSVLDSQIDLAEREVKRLKLREMRFASLKERLEQYAIYTLQRQNLRKLEGETSTLSLRNNSPAVDIYNLDAVPAEYKTIRQEVVPDKRAIKAAITKGEDVPGAHLRPPTVTLVRS